MSIQKSSAWQDNGKFEEDSKKIDYNEVDDLDSLESEKYKEDDNTDECHCSADIDPLFDTNFYLDKEMYEGYKANPNSRLKYVSTTSEKEDRVYIKLALIFMITLLIFNIIRVLLFGVGEGSKSFPLFAACTVTFIVNKIRKGL